ncbi:MAG: nucleotidyltransferase domain-containing protein [Defluviitaleaceae bacterium]|nr:nucleotidyltransferase domain-containing protein [Defluviitaleaceae bacterium]
MLTHEKISSAIAKTAELHPIKKASYFGSYADGRATSESDLDLLIEFHKPRISLFALSAIKLDLEDLLQVSVDVIHAPLSENALIQPKEVILVYEQER